MDTDTGKIYTQKEMERELLEAQNNLRSVQRSIASIEKDPTDKRNIAELSARYMPKYAPLERLPNKKCKKCYGVGHRGRDVLTNKFVPCSCTQ